MNSHKPLLVGLASEFFMTLFLGSKERAHFPKVKSSKLELPPFKGELIQCHCWSRKLLNTEEKLTPSFSLTRWKRPCLGQNIGSNQIVEVALFLEIEKLQNVSPSISFLCWGPSLIHRVILFWPQNPPGWACPHHPHPGIIWLHWPSKARSLQKCQLQKAGSSNWLGQDKMSQPPPTNTRISLPHRLCPQAGQPQLLAIAEGGRQKTKECLWPRRACCQLGIQNTVLWKWLEAAEKKYCMRSRALEPGFLGLDHVRAW